MKKSLFLALTVAFLLGCNQENTQSAEQRVQDPTLVAPSSELLAQLKLAEVGRAAVAETLRVAGRIDFDEQRLARIGATVTGRVTHIDALLGQSVGKGEVLARLNSSELSSQQLAYLKAKAQLELNKRNAERAKALFEADVIGAAELQRRESEYQIALAETRAAADQLQLLGVVKAGQSVTIEVPALGNEKLVGKLIFVGQTVDPETRTVQLRTDLDNADGRLKPAMLASMLIEAKPVERLVIPSKAVVREEDIDHVFVAEDDGVFRLVKVKLSPDHEGKRVVLSGLKGGERIVVDGAFHLNNERNRKEMEGA